MPKVCGGASDSVSADDAAALVSASVSHLNINALAVDERRVIPKAKRYVHSFALGDLDCRGRGEGRGGRRTFSQVPFANVPAGSACFLNHIVFIV
jgi:hypothetical protein